MNKPNWCLIAAASAMIAVAPSTVRADNTNPATSSTTISSTTTTVTTTPIFIPTIAPAPTGPNGLPIDYSVLTNRNFDWVDLSQAHAEGFSHHQIATIAKISDKADVPFHQVSELALDGLAFPTIADRFNLRYEDVLDSSDYESKVDNYRLAYENTGDYAARNLVAGSQEILTTTSNGSIVSADQSIADVIQNAVDLTMFSRALRTARLMKIVRGPGPLTVFAPNDAAFAKLSTDEVNALMSDRNTLTRFVDYCIIPRRIDAAAAMAMTSPTSPATLEGDSLQVTTSGGSVMVNGATVVKPDIFATNGVVHETDTVVMPPAVTSTTTNTTTTITTTPAPPAPPVTTPMVPVTPAP